MVWWQLWGECSGEVRARVLQSQALFSVDILLKPLFGVLIVSK